MPRNNPLTQGLTKTAANGETPAPAERAGRKGHVLIGGHFAQEVQTALKVVAAQERTTIRELLAEGINTVFAKRQLPEIARMDAAQ